MTAVYRIDRNQSRIEVHATATGMLSYFGHNPTFAVRNCAGTFRFEQGEVGTLGLELTVRADSLDLVDKVKPADRDEIQRRMLHEVLEVNTYPEISFRSAEVSTERAGPGRHRVAIAGPLALHGVTRTHQVRGELQVFTDGLRMQGETTLRLGDYRIAPVSALGGAIRLEDTLKLTFDLIALPEAP